MNFRMATNQADIPVIIQGAVNPPINQNQQLVVGGQTDQNTFPVIRLKICGGIQIACGILGIIGVILDVIEINRYHLIYFYNTIKLTLTISAVICSIGSVWVSFEMSMILNRLEKTIMYRYINIIEHIKVIIFKEEKKIISLCCTLTNIKCKYIRIILNPNLVNCTWFYFNPLKRA